jgi:hypothetical protein
LAYFEKLRREHHGQNKARLPRNASGKLLRISRFQISWNFEKLHTIIGDSMSSYFFDGMAQGLLTTVAVG